MKVHVCKCQQCRASKGKRKNRKHKDIIKRLLNKRRRQGKEKYTNHYWA